MDRITSVLRQEFQRMFGGEGPGLIPAIQNIPSATISQSYSGALSQYAVYGMNMGRVTHRRYGPMCQMAQLNGNAVISFRKGWAALPKTSRYSRVSLLLGHNREGFSAELFNGETSVGKKIINDSVSRMSVLQWDLTSGMNQGKIVLNGTAEIYGIALDGRYGVAMDNIPMRGSTGEIFTGINASILSQGYENMNVALIIMQFGGNAMPGIGSASKAEWYGGVMGKQIAFLKKTYPRAHILFVGPSDMSRKVNGKMQTWPYLVEVRDALKKAALENGAAFWDMFETMGGLNSMPLWVSASPQLAAPDYIHFTPRGAKRISELLLNALLNDYQLFVLRRKAAQLSKNKGISL
jgi:lysophospholipase L1-like esterase